MLYGVVEEKALKATPAIITFDFWTIRSHVLYDRDTNAAVVLQTAWRGVLERRRAEAARASRVSKRFSKVGAAVRLTSAGKRAAASVARGGGTAPQGGVAGGALRGDGANLDVDANGSGIADSAMGLLGLPVADAEGQHGLEPVGEA